MSDLIGVLVGLALTLMIFSYLWRDNVAYRLAVHALIGIAAAYATLVAFETYLWPVYLGLREDGPANAVWLIPALIGALMLLKLSPRLATFGNSAAALMVGAGAAVALVGALTGSLIPLVTRLGGGYVGLVSALLTIAVLAQFRLTARSALADPGLRQLARFEDAVMTIGRGVLSLTLGALFGAVLNTSVTLLVDRVSYFATEIGQSLASFLP
jgi:hypothetical protein